MATVAELLNRTLRRLREAANSPLIQLESGAGAVTTATGAVFLDLLNDATAEIARTVLLFPDSGTFTWAASTFTKALDTLTLTGGSGQMYQALGVRWGASAILDEMGADVLTMRTGGLRLVSTGTPLYWSQVGKDAREIAIYPTPSTGPATVTVDGWILPARLTATSDNITAFEDDELRAVENRLAGEMALMNRDDAALMERGPVWLGEYEAWRMDRWNRLTPGEQRRIGGYAPHPMAQMPPHRETAVGPMTGRGRR